MLGVQFHPEVLHTEHGARRSWPLPRAGGAASPYLDHAEHRRGAGRPRFASRSATAGPSAGCPAAWTPRSPRRSCSGPSATASPACSCDHGLLRAGEAEQVERDFVAATGVRAHGRWTPSRARSWTRWPGSVDPEQKRKIIGREFIRAFERAARRDRRRGGGHGERASFLVQGTLYPDVVESGGGTGTANIKSHHNVGGLPDDLEVPAGRAAARAVQGRGAPGRRGARPARPRSSAASRSPAPAWASGSSAR